MSNSEIGVLCLVGFGLCYWLNIFATIRAIAAFVGVILLGSSGFIGHMLNDLANLGAKITGSATGWAFGIHVALVLTFALGLVFIHDLHPKNGASKRTGFAGIALAAVLASGVSGWTGAHSVTSGVQSGVSNARQIGG